MSDIAASSFVRRELVPERAAPVKTTGFVGFLRTRLLNSPTNILLTIVSILLLWFTVIPAVKFLLIDAVWQGTDRNACLAENAGRPVGACWPYIQAKFTQFIYGFYPEPERWRVNLTKNSTLAVAIGYPDLFAVFAGTTLNQTGQAIEIIAITMGVYLLISLVTSAIMSFYGWRLGRSLNA